MANYCIPISMDPKTVLYAIAGRDSDTGALYDTAYYKKKSDRDAHLKREIAALRRAWTQTWGRRPTERDMESAWPAHIEVWETTVGKAFTVKLPKIK